MHLLQKCYDDHPRSSVVARDDVWQEIMKSYNDKAGSYGERDFTQVKEQMLRLKFSKNWTKYKIVDSVARGYSPR